MPTLRTRAAKGASLSHTEEDDSKKRPVSQKTTTYACLVSDNRSIIECSHASTPFTITLGDAATMQAAETGDYEVTITNINAAVVTVARAGSDGIDGSATSLTLNQWDSVTLAVNSAGDGYKTISRNMTGDDVQIENVSPQVKFIESGVTADNTTWDLTVDGENMLYRVVNDAYTTAVPYITVNRTGTTVDLINLEATNVQSNGSGILSNNGNAYHGRMTATTGTGTVIGGTGWGYSWSGNVCTITHSLNNANYTPLATIQGTAGASIHVNTGGANTFTVTTQSIAIAFNFWLIPD